MTRKISVSIALAVTIIAMTVTFSITWVVAMVYFNNGVADLNTKQAQYSKLTELDNYVRGNYFGTIDDTFLSDRIAQGYISGLGDRYSVYYTEKEFTEMQQIESGELVGIGLEITRDSAGYYHIARVYADSPAEKAGLTRGMRILYVDDTDANTISSVKALHSLLRGGEGTEVALTCQMGADTEQKFTVQRVNYTAPTVEFIMVNGYAYIRVSSFGPNTYAEFDYAIREAKVENAKALVFDVRGNADGQFDPAYKCIDLICPLGTIAKSENAAGVRKVLATSGEECVDKPMVVIVNENTAGAGEIFATSVRDLSGGKLVGTKTQGHGTLQSAPQRLSDGSAVSITVAMLLTGKDESFNGTGLTPDVEVPSYTDDEAMLFNPSPETDSQIIRALEQAFSLVKASGQDPGPAFIITAASSSEEVSSEETTTESDVSVQGDDSAVEGDEDTGETDSSAADSSPA